MEFNGNRYIGDIVLKRRPEGGSYLNDIPAVKYLMEAGHIELRSPVTFFIGENGTGKSTLLEAIAVAAGFNPEGGTKNFSFSTRNTHSELCDCISLTRYGYPKDGFFLRAESFYNIFIIRKCSQKKNFCLRKFTQDLSGSFQSVHSFHTDIHQKNIRKILSVQRAGFFTIRAGGSHLDIRICLKNGF